MVEKLQYWEHLPPQLASIFGFTPEGDFVPYSDDGKFSLLPSGFRAAYFRGQNQYFEKSYPSLFRIRDDKDFVIQCLKSHEFMELLSTHPILMSLEEKGVFINKWALAQHYCLCTNLMDITCDIWTAAFFATTKYDSRTDVYTPIGKEFGNGVGVLYVSKKYDDNYPNITQLGYNFLPRPHKQMASTYSMKEGDNFNDEELFDKYFFYHDLHASQWIFEMSFRQRKYWPKDIFADKANEIKRSNMISEKAIDSFEKDSEFNRWTKEEIRCYCQAAGYEITESSVVFFEESYVEKLKADWKQKKGEYFSKGRYIPIMMCDASD
jgi:hypothetical protein